MNKDPVPSLDSWGDILKQFVLLVIQSPLAVAAFALSFFMGYGISFVLFDYRLKESLKKTHYLFHVSVGLCYTALVFCVFNYRAMAMPMSPEQIAERIPATLLFSLALGFIIIIVVAIWREVRPFQRR
jgi:predicted permease